MNSKIKKKLSVFLAAFVALGVFTAGLTAFGEDNIAVNEFNFPDPVFKQVVSEEFDEDGDGYLSPQEREQKVISLSGLIDEPQEIKNLKGIEFFANSLNALYCGGIGLEELDASALTSLKQLSCQGNTLKALDVSKNSALISLDCSNNELTSLTLGNNTNLQVLHCYANSLEKIDLSGVTGLTTLHCQQNKLSSINLTKLTALSDFMCASNNLPSIDLTANTSLTGVTAYQIGDQRIDAKALNKGDYYVVPVAVGNADRITSAEFENGTPTQYQGLGFTATDASLIENRIKYTYSVGKSDCEDLEVYVYATRNFYQVSFYDDDAHQSFLGNRFADYGKTVTAPTPTPQQCKVFNGWSEDISTVTGDIAVHPLWSDSHKYALTGFSNHTAQITCSDCGSSYTVNFNDCINKSKGEQGYCEYLDVHSDGIINAKDYAVLIKMF